MSAHVNSIAEMIRDNIADASEDDGKLTQEGADHLSAVFTNLSKRDRGEVFSLLDGSPGLWNYKDSQGREYHWKLRQFRNYHRDLFISTFAAD